MFSWVVGVQGPEVYQIASEKLPSQERIVFQLPFFRGELLNFRGVLVYLGSQRPSKTSSFGGMKKHQTKIVELIKVTLQVQVDHFKDGDIIGFNQRLVSFR